MLLTTFDTQAIWRKSKLFQIGTAAVFQSACTFHTPPLAHTFIDVKELERWPCT